MRSNVVLALTGSLLLAACSAPSATGVDLMSSATTASLAKGVAPAPISPDLTGHWTQTNQTVFVSPTLGTTTYSWYEFDARQSGATLSGSAVRHMNIFDANGTLLYDNITGSPGKLTGTVKTDGTASIVFNRIEETKITVRYNVKLDASGQLVVVAPAANGPQAFKR